MSKVIKDKDLLEKQLNSTIEKYEKKIDAMKENHSLIIEELNWHIEKQTIELTIATERKKQMK